MVITCSCGELVLHLEGLKVVSTDGFGRLGVENLRRINHILLQLEILFLLLDLTKVLHLFLVEVIFRIGVNLHLATRSFSRIVVVLDMLRGIIVYFDIVLQVDTVDWWIEWRGHDWLFFVQPISWRIERRWQVVLLILMLSEFSSILHPLFFIRNIFAKAVDLVLRVYVDQRLVVR